MDRAVGLSSVTRSFGRAEIIAVGSELLSAVRSDTNSVFLASRLNELGIDVRTKTIVGDCPNELSEVLRHSLLRNDFLVICGGLGPTDDDVTREVVAEVLGLPLKVDEAIVDRIRKRFKSRGLRMPDINRRQAMVPEGAVVLENTNGTAQGLWIDEGRKTLILLPGPPRELNPMFENLAEVKLRSRTGSQRFFRRVLKITGSTESYVEARVQPIYSKWKTGEHPITTTVLSALGQIELHLSLRIASNEKATAILDEATREITVELGHDVFSTDGRILERVIGDQLRVGGYRIALAESCTGGLLASRLTDVPGSSDYMTVALVTYSNEAKVELLGIPESTLEKHGAVSEPVALAMAKGVRSLGRTEIGVGLTGIAGPDGETKEKPIGTVAIAVVGPSPSDKVDVRTTRFTGEREQIKFQASQTALDVVRRLLLEQSRCSTKSD